MPVYHYRKVFPEVIRTIQKARFYRTCSKLLHTKSKIKNHDPVKQDRFLKWNFQMQILHHECWQTQCYMKGYQDVSLKLQRWQLYHEL